MDEIKHEGCSPHRLNIHNLEEMVFAEEWKKKCEMYNLLPYLLNENHGGAFVSGVSQRDAFVAATIVQWLGTNVGSGFLQVCLERIAKEKPDNKIAREMLQRMKGR